MIEVLFLADPNVSRSFFAEEGCTAGTHSEPLKEGALGWLSLLV